MKIHDFRTLFTGQSETLAYRQEAAVLALTEAILERMEVLDISRKELANRLGHSPAWVSKLLSGGNNFTLETMVKIADALAASVEVRLVSKSVAEDAYPEASFREMEVAEPRDEDGSR